MLHRLIVIGIVGFWLAMTGLLVVRELYPESTRLNAVPVSYVGQLLFQHEQASDLEIRSGNKDDDIGFLRIQPGTDTATGMRTVEFTGGISLGLRGDRSRRLSWIGFLELSRSLSVERIRVSISPPEPSQNIEIALDLVNRKAAISAKVGSETLDHTEISLDQAGLDSLLARAGVEPALVQQFKASRGEMPEFFFGAQSSSTVLGGQKLSTFLLTLKAGDQILFDAHVSQLGQVLRAQAPLLGLRLNLSR